MEFLQKNARALIIALLTVGVIVAISTSGDSDTEDTTAQESSDIKDDQEVKEPETAADEKDETAGSSSDVDTDAESSDTEETIVAEDKEEETAEETAAPESSVSTVERNQDTYRISAVTGDNQTVLVRKMIDQYNTENDVVLNAEQFLYAETNLVNDITRSDYIIVGTTAELTGAEIKERVEQARKLDEAQQALWSQYL